MSHLPLSAPLPLTICRTWTMLLLYAPITKIGRRSHDSAVLLFFLTLAPCLSFTIPEKRTLPHTLLHAREPRRTRRKTTRRSDRSVTIQRAPHQFDHTQAQARPFVVDALTEIQSQEPNENSGTFDLQQALNDEHSTTTSTAAIIDHAHIRHYGLDDLFPGLRFSQIFATHTTFRTALRDAIRRDVFETTPTYHGLSDKAKHFLLLPDSSLQGSWKCKNGGWSRTNEKESCSSGCRMNRVTTVLREALGPEAPTGDVFMDAIGGLCTTSEVPSSEPKQIQATTHWMDIVGVLTRKIPHSWHQDLASNKACTVLLGFPAEDQYEGVGVFSHVVKLKQEQWRQKDSSSGEVVINEPVVYPDVSIEDELIVRPRFRQGRELIVYRDIDVLHSSPDIAYRASVMRFM